MAKILIVDIECAPKLAYVWKFFKENVGAKQVLDHGYIMSYAAKWYGSDKIIYNENRKIDDSKISNKLIKLLDQADVVVAHNADNFDIPTINSRAIVNGLTPPSPYKVVDTLKVARRNFKFESNSLEYLATVLGCSPKLSHKKFPGFELWLACIQNNDDAWDELREYNIQDVITLEEVYEKIRPWAPNHPNIGNIDGKSMVCPKCGSDHLQHRGYYKTSVSTFKRFQCQNCGSWPRARISEKGEYTSGLLVNAV